MGSVDAARRSDQQWLNGPDSVAPRCGLCPGLRHPVFLSTYPYFHVFVLPAIRGLQRRETLEIGLIWRSQASREASCSHALRSPEAGDSAVWPDLAPRPPGRRVAPTPRGLQRQETREISWIWRFQVFRGGRLGRLAGPGDHPRSPEVVGSGDWPRSCVGNNLAYEHPLGILIVISRQAVTESDGSHRVGGLSLLEWQLLRFFSKHQCKQEDLER